MAINKAAKAVLKALSFPDFDLKVSRKLANMKAVDPLKLLYKTIDYQVYNGDYEVPMRIYIPDEHVKAGKNMERNTFPVLLFFHGGGFVTESVDTYNKVCWNLANSTNHVVVSVDYRLAPEHRFPIGIEDCYAAAKAIFQERTILNVDPDRITIIGDSAGGNITAVLCQMARDRGDFTPKRQILIYPCTDSDYSEHSIHPSVMENGTDYLLTRKDMEEYMDLYKSCDEDLENPYLAPLKAKDLSHLPKTLLITAQYDPLRDEGEAYGKRLIEAGNDVEMHRIDDALHGFFALSTKYFHVKDTLEYINSFLSEVWEDVSIQEDKMEEAGECC
ncbi:MAG: alpha/beta hydrolase [Lachnospiraceae bacterium]|nr:alpha/beta hydrolase [Lachnospiraceae bacterium]MDD3615377.1 alpha/beta hydrolase [Lachnospiraceae bacterium]